MGRQDLLGGVGLFGRLDGQPMGRATRTFAWPGRCRSLSKGLDKTVPSSESFVKLAMIQLMLHRLRPWSIDPEFRYPTPEAA